MDTLLKSYVEKIINTLATPARIIGGVLIVLSIALTSIQLILSKKSETRTEIIEQLPYIAIASFVLGTLATILGFFNTFTK
ncbi:putative membrane protein [Clostridium argentinense CDC 2741]|uniref:Uncharacterized protein n=2 Tax=Clostridium argentinense TaxID=29341 RepID=A0A7I6N151_9CLOT|nr:hypothetical protein [Clostridium argentinense]ARC83109.1 hypothetical protein RSJ17_00205 [Clostridium argentinense]KIE44728.1 putative membrane protein [Clostridium argentinense CDC 2741]NFF41338.1 hypothetical protein [Clostridium argentinense]NFP51767.1 hypothetical protein [Clostridium argentinense]NFP74263.1 hypothetical protein [Clostridium argentinense]